MDLTEALASTASAQAQMRFQERMSNTAVQRQVADMKAAGINPVLAAKYGGASTPTGAEGDYSAVLGLLSQSMETSAKAVSSMGKSLQDAIKSGLPNSDQLGAIKDLQDAFSNFGSRDYTGFPVINEAIDKFVNFIPDDFKFRTRYASFTGKEVKQMLGDYLEFKLPKKSDWQLLGNHVSNARDILFNNAKSKGDVYNALVRDPVEYFTGKNSYTGHRKRGR